LRRLFEAPIGRFTYPRQGNTPGRGAKALNDPERNNE